MLITVIRNQCRIVVLCSSFDIVDKGQLRGRSDARMKKQCKADQYREDRQQKSTLVPNYYLDPSGTTTTRKPLFGINKTTVNPKNFLTKTHHTIYLTKSFLNNYTVKPVEEN